MSTWIVESLPAVAGRLGLPEGGAAWAGQWTEAMSAAPSEPPAWLGERAVVRGCADVRMDAAMTTATASAAKRVAEDAALRTLAWYGHYRLFVAQPPVMNVNWPLPAEALGRDAGLFNVLLLLSGLERLAEIHRRRGIPADVARETVADLALCLGVEDYTAQHGYWGISNRIMNWLLSHWHGRLYRLGRLQFVPGRFFGDLRVFRHRRDGTVVALSQPGIRYRADGQLDGAGDVHDPDGAWTAELVESPEAVEGMSIHPAGYAVARRVRLASADWQCVLAPRQEVLDVHIPAGAPMDYDQCGRSMARALEFFPRHFPERPFVAWACCSWLLDGQFEQLLPATSNLVRFQREVYLFPIAEESRGALRTVFGLGVDLTDPAGLPRRTTMQRAFADHLQRGGHFRGGGCFLLRDDLKWGQQVYRRQNWPW